MAFGGVLGASRVLKSPLRGQFLEVLKMGIIKELTRDVVERIAAGEVVERPASVIKELVENAIDARATCISVEIADGGKDLIAISDDGCGMSPEDLGFSILRHHTSKISVDTDLWKIHTMGFRGEALAAIGAVSRMEISSRVNLPDIVEGASLRVEGGDAAALQPAGCAGGTRVVIRDLFFNVPARKKFLKSTAVELGHIVDLITEYSLGFPHIRFELSSDGKSRLRANSLDERERVLEILGSSISNSLIRVDEGTPDISVRGWIAEKGRARARDVHVFLNRRPVRDRVLMHALTQAFGERLDRGQFPSAVLWVEIDSSKVDVNVHPAKREVRFVSSGAVHDFVKNCVRKSLQSCDIKAASVVDQPEELRLGSSISYKEGIGAVGLDLPTPTFPCKGEGSLDRDQGQMAITGEPALRPIGQLGRTYLVCEDTDSTLVLIDQHAAHESLGFKELKAQFESGDIAQQRLLIPEQLDLGAKEFGYISENFGLLTGMGFEVEPFGGTTLLVKAVPALLGGVGLATLFDKLAHEFEELGSSEALEEAVDKVFAVVACHAQVRAGDRLSSEEMRGLIDDMNRNEITHCPHGRPAMVRIDRSEIEKWFKRRK
jgi:DNA mismatch repair protein MutL